MPHFKWLGVQNPVRITTYWKDSCALHKTHSLPGIRHVIYQQNPFTCFTRIWCLSNEAAHDWPAEVDNGREGWCLAQVMDDNQPTVLTTDRTRCAQTKTGSSTYCDVQRIQTKSSAQSARWWHPGKTTAGGDKHQEGAFHRSYLPLMYCSSGFAILHSS